jgi:hypothetical protein
MLPIAVLRLRRGTGRVRGPAVILLFTVGCICPVVYESFAEVPGLPIVVIRLVVRQLPIQALTSALFIAILVRYRIVPRTVRAMVLSVVSSLIASYFVPRLLPFHWCQHTGLVCAMLWVLRLVMASLVLWSVAAVIHDWRRFRRGTIGYLSVPKRFTPVVLVALALGLEKIVISRCVAAILFCVRLCWVPLS